MGPIGYPETSLGTYTLRNNPGERGSCSLEQVAPVHVVLKELLDYYNYIQDN
jgi:hypothetical protein